jgi:signal transduction histidine kinase
MKQNIYDFPFNIPMDKQTIFRILVMAQKGDEMEIPLTRMAGIREFMVESATGGKHVLKLLRDNHGEYLDIILLEILLPDASGLDLCREVRHMYPKNMVPIIAVLSENQSEEMASLYDCGVNDYLVKPFSGEELLLRVRSQADMLDLRKKENQIRDRLYQVDRLITIGSTMSAVMHEINNFITVIKTDTILLRNRFGYIKKVLDEYLDTEGDFSVGSHTYSTIKDNDTDVYERILRNSSRISTLAQAIQTFSRKESMHGEMVQMTDVIKEALKLCGLKARKARVAWKKKLPGKIPPIAGHGQLLLQAVVNLFNNAIEAADKEDAYIAVTLHFQKKAGLLYIIIEDNGKGIEEKDRNRLFEPFFTTKRNQGGTGLGLSLVLKIITGHDGFIRLESERGAGTIVTLMLPVFREKGMGIDMQKNVLQNGSATNT